MKFHIPCISSRLSTHSQTNNTHEKEEKSHPKRRTFLFTFCFIRTKRWEKRREREREWERKPAKRRHRLSLELQRQASAAKKRNDEPENRFLARISPAPVNSFNNSHSWIECKFILSFISLPSTSSLLSLSPLLLRQKVEMDFSFFLFFPFSVRKNSEIGDWETQRKNVIKRNKKKFFATFFLLKDSLLSSPCLLPLLLRITSTSKRISIKNSCELLFPHSQHQLRCKYSRIFFGFLFFFWQKEFHALASF